MSAISKEIKYALNEDIQKFDVTEYDEDPDEMVDYNTIKQVNGIENVNDTLILWSDLNTYTLEDVINDIPKSGYPIGINIFHNEYVSLKYMSNETPEIGTKTPEHIVFSNSYYTDIPANITIHYNDLYNGNIDDLLVDMKNGAYKLLNNKAIFNKFKDCFNGKVQTKRILKEKSGYPAAENVYEFNPGETQKGDWYLPEIGELVQIYAYKNVINYICKELITLGYIDIYPQIQGKIWASTFYAESHMYYVDMDINGAYVFFKQKENFASAIAMYQQR